MTRSLLVVGLDLDPQSGHRLAALGVDVEHVATIATAQLRAQPPRAALVAWELDSGSGPGLCARLKRDAALSSIWIVLCSDHGEALQEHAHTSATPADAYLEQPFDLASLERALAPSGVLEPEADDERATSEARPDDGVEEQVEAEELDSPIATEGIRTRDASSHADVRARLEGLTATSETNPPHRASPEERLRWIRRHARDLESRNHALAALAAELLDSRDQIEGQLAGAHRRSAELEAALEAERAETERVRRAFQSYEAEVHRVVQAKQTEERAAAEALRIARDRIAALEQTAEDDARRRAILEGELERLDEAARAESRATEALRRALAESRERAEQLEARVSAADGLVDEMQSEIVALRARVRDDAGVEARVSDLQAQLRRWTEAAAQLERALTSGLS